MVLTRYLGVWYYQMIIESVLFLVILDSRFDGIMYNNPPPLSVLNSSSIVSSVQSLILPNQLVFGLPLGWSRGVIPWVISFSTLLPHYVPKVCHFPFLS